jgi:hypothetical protein
LRAAWWLPIILSVAAFVPDLDGQDAVPPDLTPNGAGLTPHEINALQGQSSDTHTVLTNQGFAETPRRFNYGITLTVRGVYDDNIFISSFNRQSDFYFSIEPMIVLGFGGDDSAGSSSLNFTYRPGFFIFLDHSEEDTLQHLLRLSGNHIFGRLTVSFSQDVQLLNGADLNSLSDPTGHNANIDVGQRTQHNIYTTVIADTYDLTGKLFLSNSLGLTVNSYPSGFIGSNNLSGNLFLNYNYSEKVVIGIGGTGGYGTAEGSPDQIYEQANIRISYAASAKTNLSFSGGAEFRQFENDSRGTYVSPVFELSGSYRPFDGTAITLSGSRHIQNSAVLTGQDYTQTDFHLTVTQRFLTRLTLGLSVGYERSQYFGAAQGINATRDDDYYYVQPSIDAMITRWSSAGAYYLYRKDSSSLPIFSFYDNQVGLRATVTF